MKTLYIATPTHDGRVHVGYARSLISTIGALTSRGIRVETDIAMSGADINAARNNLVHGFLDSGCGAMLFIDSDLSWPADAVFKLIDSKKLVVGGIYPKKVAGEEWVVRHKPGEHGARLMPVLGLGGGFLLIRREALVKFALIHQDRHYKTKDDKDRVAFFNGGLHHGRVLSEDLDFCAACTEAGVEVFARTDIDFTHSGNHEWRGNYAEFMNRKAQAQAEVAA